MTTPPVRSAEVEAARDEVVLFAREWLAARSATVGRFKNAELGLHLALDRLTAAEQRDAER